MNKRIRELSLKAFEPINAISSEGVADRRTFDEAWFQLYNQKFAELILTEVSDILTTYRGKIIFVDGFEYNCEHPIVAIRKHFGVEE